MNVDNTNIMHVLDAGWAPLQVRAFIQENQLAFLL